MLHVLICPMLWLQTLCGKPCIEAGCGWGCTFPHAQYQRQMRCLGDAVCLLQWLRWKQTVRLNSLALALTMAGKGQIGERLLSGWKVSAFHNQARQVCWPCSRV